MIEEFLAGLPFAPDRFQVEAIEAIIAGQSIVVTAPTGSGKTLIAEAAVHVAMSQGRRSFYTTPLKALSNQKFGDFRRIYPRNQVGLLTGDNSINGDAPVVVMTTEVLRNMIYAGSEDLTDVGFVVLDEVHYLQDPSRGAVWEEVIIHLPAHVAIVALSATVSNPGEFLEWVRARRGRTHLVVETHRPVPLEVMLLVKDTQGGGQILEPVFDGDRTNHRLQRLLRPSRHRRRRFLAPRRLDVAELLDDMNRLPAIYFVFSRAGCESAADRVAEGATLTTVDEASAIARFAGERTAHIDDADRAALGYERWLRRLRVGVAAHHAGIVPAFKETVEELFAAGLVKLVFATETLSLGINMPARTVVLESLSKYTGEGHELLQPGDFTQLTGRAGRRGIDERGTAIVLYSPHVPFERIAGIAAAGSHPLQSSFRPTYNMAVNLVARYPRSRAEELLNASFGQFQSQREADELISRIAEGGRSLDVFRRSAECDRGDIWSTIDKGSQTSHRTLMGGFARELEAGDVVEWGGGRRVVLARSWTGTSPRIMVLGDDGRVVRYRPRDLPADSIRIGAIELPEPFRPREHAYQRDVLARLRELEPVASERLEAYGAVSSDEVLSCPEYAEHRSWARRAQRLERDLERWRRRRSRLAAGLVGEFQDLLDLLERWGFVTGWSLTEKGDRLRFVYNELDVAVVEAVAAGLFEGLTAAETAALASAFVYEPRVDSERSEWPTPRLKEAGDLLDAIDHRITAAEQEAGLPVSRPPEAGFAGLAHSWADGAELEELLDDDLAAGDFVRNCRQLIDLLRQLRDAFNEVADQANAALHKVDRGVVAAGGVE